MPGVTVGARVRFKAVLTGKRPQMPNEVWGHHYLDTASPADVSILILRIPKAIGARLRVGRARVPGR
jgi:hypothetical protein